MAEQKGAMPNPVISTEGLPREEWLAYRRKGIGGSDAAAVLGISPFRTRSEERRVGKECRL